MYLQPDWNLICTFTENPGADSPQGGECGGFQYCLLPCPYSHQLSRLSHFPSSLPLLPVNVILPVENWVKYSANLGVVAKSLYYLSPSLCKVNWSISFMVGWPHELCFNSFVKSNWQFSCCTSEFMLSHPDLKAVRFIPSFLVHSLLFFHDTLLGKVSCPVSFSCQISSLLSPPQK